MFTFQRRGTSAGKEDIYYKKKKLKKKKVNKKPYTNDMVWPRMDWYPIQGIYLLYIYKTTVLEIQFR